MHQIEDVGGISAHFREDCDDGFQSLVRRIEGRNGAKGLAVFQHGIHNGARTQAVDFAADINIKTIFSQRGFHERTNGLCRSGVRAPHFFIRSTEVFTGPSQHGRGDNNIGVGKHRALSLVQMGVRYESELSLCETNHGNVAMFPDQRTLFHAQMRVTGKSCRARRTIVILK